MTDNRDKLNIDGVEMWGPGEPVDHQKLNQPGNILNKMGAPAPPSQVIPHGNKFQVRLMRVIRLETDVVICNFTDGVTDQEDEVKVALPYLLRKSPFDSAGDPVPALADEKFKYTFTFAKNGEPRYDKRTSIDTTNGDDEEIQVITLKYDVSNLLFAMRGIFGGTGVFHDEAKEQPIIWQDMDQSRMWAKSSEDDDEEL